MYNFINENMKFITITMLVCYRKNNHLFFNNSHTLVMGNEPI